MDAKLISIGIVGIVIIVTPAILLGMVYNYYRKYYIYMRDNHRNTWEYLMKKDSAIELIGEWYRWPFGSGYLIKAFFTKNNTDDANIISIKRKSNYCLKLFAITMLLAIIFIISLK
jgi:hypothetical protein